ncbi:MAG: hypothetical protein U0638_12450 [Phycisphaerales bacterium]
MTTDSITSPLSPTPIRLRSVTSQGLSSCDAEVAEREVHVLLELAQRAQFHLRKPVELTVCLTTDLAAEVDRFNQEHGIPSSEYQRQRPDGISFGIVLTPPEDQAPASHTIVVDASLWVDEAGANIVHRTFGLAYLIGHLLNRHDCERPGPQPSPERGRHARTVHWCSHTLQCAWSDSILAIDLCNSCLRDSDGNPVQLSDFLAADSLAVASELLDQMCVFATFDVNAYRVFGIDLDDLYPTAIDLAFGLLRTSVVLIVLSASDRRIDPILGALHGLNGYAEFLEPVWPAIVDGCANEDASARATAFELALTELLRRMGLRIEDLEGDDIYIHVDAPVTCSWVERPEVQR